MRISCSLQIAPKLGLNETLALIRGAGYTAVELSWPRVASEWPHGDPVRHLEDRLRELRLTVSGFCLTDFDILDDHRLGRAVEDLRAQMSLARELNAPSVILRAGDRRRQSLDLLIRGISALLPSAEQLDLQVAVANAFKRRIEGLEDLRHIVAEVRHPRLRLLVDTGEFHLAAVNPTHVLSEFAGLIDGIRITDLIGRRPTTIGEGEMNVPAIFDRIRRDAFDGWLVAEPGTADAAGVAEVLTSTRIYMEHLLAVLHD